VNAGLEETNWIPRSFQEGAKNQAKEAVEYFVRPNQVIGLGSGPMAAAIVREMANFDGKETLEVFPLRFR
jgi:ribose 5-phosphate isomerase